MELEMQLQELEKQRLDSEADIHTRKEKMEEQTRRAQDAKEAAERELHGIRLEYLNI